MNPLLLIQRRERMWITLLVIALGLQILGYALVSRQCAIGVGCDAYGYFAAARAVARGEDMYAEALPISHADGRTTILIRHYIYPPPLAVVLVPITWLGPRAEIPIWMGVVTASIVSLCVMLFPILGWRLALLAVLGFMPTWETFRMGQINALVALMTTLAILNVNRPGRAAAALTGGALLKIMPGLGLLVLLRYTPRQAIIGIAAVAILALALTVPFTGFDGWIQGLTIAWQVKRSTYGMAAIGPHLATLPGWAGQYAPAVLTMAITLATLTRIHRIPMSHSLAALSLVPLIAAPIVWTHHLVMALPALAILWIQSGRGAWLAGITWLAGALVAAQPAIIVLLPFCWVALCWPGFFHGLAFRPMSAHTRRPEAP